MGGALEVIKFISLFFKFFSEVKAFIEMLEEHERDKKIDELSGIIQDLKNAKTDEERKRLAARLGGFGPS